MKDNQMIDEIMVKMFAKMYSDDIIRQLVKPDVTEYERGKVAGRLEMLTLIALELNPQSESENEAEITK